MKLRGRDAILVLLVSMVAVLPSLFSLFGNADEVAFSEGVTPMLLFSVNGAVCLIIFCGDHAFTAHRRFDFGDVPADIYLLIAPLSRASRNGLERFANAGINIERGWECGMLYSI
jgi:hypothetical protein